MTLPNLLNLKRVDKILQARSPALHASAAMYDNMPFVLENMGDHNLNNVLVPLWYVRRRRHLDDWVLEQTDAPLGTSSFILLDISPDRSYFDIAEEAYDHRDALLVILLNVPCDISAVPFAVSGQLHILARALRESKPRDQLTRKRLVLEY